VVGLLLAHAGPGSTWQAAVVVAGIALAVVVLLAAARVVRITEPADLVTPLAAAAGIGTLGLLAHAWISDGIGWGLPLAVVALATLVLAATTPLELAPLSPLTTGAVALAAVAMWVLYTPLTIALHPPADLLPLADDAAVRIVAPADGATLEPGTVQMTVEVTGGSIGPPHTPLEALPDDPEQAGSLSVHVDGDRHPVDWDGCTLAEPCHQVTVEVELEPGERRLAVEFTRGDGTPFAPSVTDRVTVEVR
jgi:hypothetical protein